MSGPDELSSSAPDARGTLDAPAPAPDRRRARFVAGGGRWGGRALTIISALAVMAMLVNIVLDVLLRFVFDRPITGTLEFTTYYYMIAITFVGAFAAQQRLEHIEVTALVDRMAPIDRLYFSVVADVITLAFLAALAWYGWEVAMESREQGEVAGATQVIVWPMRFLVPFGIAAYAVQLLVDMLRAFARGAAPEHEILPEESVL